MAEVKRLTKKRVEKMFHDLYPDGEICLDGTFWNWWYTTDANNARTKSLHACNLDGVVKELYLG